MGPGYRGPPPPPPPVSIADRLRHHHRLDGGRRAAPLVGDSAHAFVAGGGFVPGVGNVLARRRWVLLGQQPAGRYRRSDW